MQFVAYVAAGAHKVVLGRHVVACRIDDSLLHRIQCVAGKGINDAHGLYFITKEVDTQGLFMAVGRNDLYGITPDPESSPVKVVVIALILHLDKVLHELFHGNSLSFFHGNDEACIVLGRS